jgi:hypothetical protein
MATATDETLEKTTPRSLAIAERGIRTGNDFANLMSAMMSDLIEGRVTPSIGNATCNAGGKLLKVVEMQCKYGTQGKGGQGARTLILAIESPTDDEAPAHG